MHLGPRGTPAYRRARRRQRLSQRISNFLAIDAMSPRDVYCGLLWYGKFKGWNPKFPLAAFREICGAWPRPQDKEGEPVRPPIELEQWIINNGPKRKKGKHG